LLMFRNLEPQPRHRHSGVARRGMTMLEVVLAVLVLGLVTVAITSTLSYVVGQRGYNEARLAGYELANRLVIQHLDDESVLESMAGKPLDYANRRFRFDYNVDRVEMKVKQADLSTNRPGPRGLD